MSFGSRSRLSVPLAGGRTGPQAMTPFRRKP